MREERLALFEQLGVPPTILMSVDVLLRLCGVHRMPVFGPFVHGRNGSALWDDPKRLGPKAVRLRDGRPLPAGRRHAGGFSW